MSRLARNHFNAKPQRCKAAKKIGMAVPKGLPEISPAQRAGSTAEMKSAPAGRWKRLRRFSFTAEDHNKELKVLAQSYDWLLFLSDKGLAEFINELLLHPTPQLKPAKDAFLASYPTGKGNRFTKKTMDVEADIVLKKYSRFRSSRARSRRDQHRPLEKLCFWPRDRCLFFIRHAFEISCGWPRRRQGRADVLRDGLLGKKL
jgi:hypothetical protein